MENLTTDGKLCIERELQIVNNDLDFNDLITKFDITETCSWITNNNCLKVCLQFPDDLLGISAKIYHEIKKRVDVDLYILGDTTYASCCIDSVAAMHVQGNAIVHYGHTCFSKTNIPVFRVLPKKDLVFEEAMKIIHVKFNTDDNVKLCLFYGAEFHHCIDEISKTWFQYYPHSYLSYVELEDMQEKFMGRVVRNQNGEVFPVDVLADCVCIYIGSRGQTLFNYTVTIAASEWYNLDPDESKMERSEETTWFKRRRYLIEKCKDAKVVGILICDLSGDHTQKVISRMKQVCKLNGKKSYIVSVGKPNVPKLANFPEIDIYVMIACPENDLYNARDFYKPIIYPYELEVALNSNREPFFTTHVTDYDQLLPGNRNYCELKHPTQTTDVSLITGMIREIKVESQSESSTDLAEKQNWALESIGQNLQDRSWKGLEQKLGETEVKKAEEGRKGIPLQYSNEPE